MGKHNRSKLKHASKHGKNPARTWIGCQQHVAGSRSYTVDEDMYMSKEPDRRNLKNWTKQRRNEQQRHFRSIMVGHWQANQERWSAEIHPIQSTSCHREKTKYQSGLRDTFEEDWDESERFFPSAVGAQHGQLKRDHVNRYHKEQGPSRKRRRSTSPLWGSAAEIDEVSSDNNVCELGSVSNEICRNNTQKNRGQATVPNETRDSRRSFSPENDREDGQTCGSECLYGGSVNVSTKHGRFGDMSLSVSTKLHDVRSSVDRFPTKEILQMPMSLRSSGSSNTKQTFIAKALAELVALKKETGGAVQGVRMSDFRKRLYSHGITFESHESYTNIMSSLRAYFLITYEGMIEPRTDVKICESYTQNPKLKGCHCHDLHICKFFLVGKCLSGKSCKFSHNIFHPHNQDVLKRYFLHKMDPEDIGEIISYIHNRNATTSPTVCKFYNNEGGCIQEQRCQHLHVCRHFVNRTCKFGAHCKRDHNFISELSKNILLKYGLFEYRTNHKVLFKLIEKNLQDGVIVTQKFPNKKFKMENQVVDGLQSTSGDNQQEEAHPETLFRYFQVPPINKENAKKHKKSRKMKVRKRKKSKERDAYADEFSLEEETGRTLKTADDFCLEVSLRDLQASKRVDHYDNRDTLACSAMESHTFKTHSEQKNGSTVKPKTTLDDLIKQLHQVVDNVQKKTRGGTENKAFDNLSKKADGFENFKTKEISKGTFQKYPYVESIYTKQSNRRQSVEEGEIIDDTPADSHQVADSSNSYRTCATVALTNSTNPNDLDHLEEYECENKTDLEEELYKGKANNILCEGCTVGTNVFRQINTVLVENDICSRPIW